MNSTTQISTVRTETLPALAKPVALSGSLAYHVAGDTVIDGHIVRAIGKPGAADIAEARRKLQEAEHLCRPADPRDIAVWCKRLDSLPWAPKDEDAHKAAIMGICMACARLPAAVWTAETATIALQTWKRWPAAADVYELMSTHARPFTKAAAGLRKVAGMTADMNPEVLGDPTPDAKLHVAEVVKAFVDGRSWNDPNHPDHLRTKPPVKALHLSDGALLAEYDRIASEGGPFAQSCAVRAAHIRSRMEKEYKDAL
jgi:hypothetical protein